MKLAYNDSPPCLRLEFCNGDQLLLPWARFVEACLDGETLTIEFHNRRIEITGRNLDQVSDAIGDGKLAGLRELPPDYAAVSEGKPYVSAIRVEAVQD
ncbi:hypothetical protein [Opitutus sp. ER46]|uniref:hypothetical protein n=1 Tax=Opitutus sp. ER46 TaxID=2161864 RepID=UPI0011B202F6|nr:hypothetical protein [Opitutus sp. ER46]